MSLYKSVFRPVFFLFSPERIHGFVLGLLVFCRRSRILDWFLRWIYGVGGAGLVQELFGVRFEHPVGLAAGFDKGGRWLDSASSVGFAFSEIGTVTPLAQPGNAKPRLFRLPEDMALINRMGLNGPGADLVAARMKKLGRRRIPLGISISKNTATENADALSDYLVCIDRLHRYADYFVLNVSCPNVSGLREQQSPHSLEPLLNALVTHLNSLERPIPFLVKFSSDEPAVSLREAVKTALRSGVSGFIVSNTTVERAGLRTDADRLSEIGNGGLSGAPLFSRALEAVRVVRDAAGEGVPIIGVGGVFTGAQALLMLQAGANLVQVYTGFIYEGPGAVRRIVRYLRKHRAEIELVGAPVK